VKLTKIFEMGGEGKSALLIKPFQLFLKSMARKGMVKFMMNK
jgi:hypothetical protein